MKLLFATIAALILGTAATATADINLVTRGQLITKGALCTGTTCRLGRDTYYCPGSSCFKI